MQHLIVSLALSGVHALSHSRLQEAHHHQRVWGIQGHSGVDPGDGRGQPDEGAERALRGSYQDHIQPYCGDILCEGEEGAVKGRRMGVWCSEGRWDGEGGWRGERGEVGGME